MAKKSVIETGVDKLVRLISDKGKVSVNDAAKELGVSAASIKEWADFLEEEDIISVETKLATTYLVEKKLGRREVLQKVKAVAAEKESLKRRIESSVNALHRDADEIKLVGAEFRGIREMLQQNFKSLSKRLDKLDNARSVFADLENQKRLAEKKFSSSFVQLEKKLSEENSEYAKLVANISTELKRMDAEKTDLDVLKKSEKDMITELKKIDENIRKLHSNIDEKNKHIDAHDDYLTKAEDRASKLKRLMESHKSELSEISKDLDSAKKDIESSEKAFVDDIKSINEGRLKKLSVYIESRQLLDKIESFFSKTKQLESALSDLEKEEQKLDKEFGVLTHKVSAFTAAASSSKVRGQLDDMYDEIREIEERKNLLSKKLNDIRSIIRSVMK